MIGMDLQDIRNPKDPEEALEYSFSFGLFVLVHIIGIFGPFYVGFSWAAFLTAVALYFIRMFFVTAFNHRYFAHRTFKIVIFERQIQFLMAFLCSMEMQKGVLWWAYWHRHHHKYSDTPQDVHSRKLRGLYWSHVGWILCKKYKHFKVLNDFSKNTEIIWLEKGLNHLIGPVVYGFLCALWGYFLGERFGTNTLQMIVWAVFTSTVCLYHGTFSINSFAHMVGKQRFDTGEESRNSWWLAILTLGEGWHNNHHENQHRAAQALTKKEYYLDFTYWGLRFLEFLKIIKINPHEKLLTTKLLKKANIA